MRVLERFMQGSRTKPEENQLGSTGLPTQKDYQIAAGTVAPVNPIKLSTKLSKNFKLAELVHSNTASRLNIYNIPDEQEVDNLKRLAREVLQPIRTATCAPLIISSGYRNEALNTEIGGSSTSQHMLGEAADILSTALDPKELAEKILEMGIEFDQLILEYYDKENGDGWVHISKKASGNRMEVLTKLKNVPGYQAGLVVY